MKKFVFAIFIGILCTLSNISLAFATGNAEGGFTISQIELIDYVILAGAAIFLIGMILIFLSLYLNSSRSKFDEEFEEDDDIAEDEGFSNEIDFDEFNKEDEPPIDLELDNQDIVDTEAEPTADEDNTNEVGVSVTPVAEVEEEVQIEPVEEDTQAEPIEEEAQAEPIEEVTQAEPVEEDTEETGEDSTEEEIIEEEQATPSIRLTFSGINNSDLKIIDIKDTITVGRRSSNDLVISDNAVSGEHCRLTYDGNAVFIEDLNSTNGTVLNDETIEKAELKSGDTIILGKNQYKISISLI